MPCTFTCEIICSLLFQLYNFKTTTFHASICPCNPGLVQALLLYKIINTVSINNLKILPCNVLKDEVSMRLMFNLNIYYVIELFDITDAYHSMQRKNRRNTFTHFAQRSAGMKVFCKKTD